MTESRIATTSRAASSSPFPASTTDQIGSDIPILPPLEAPLPPIASFLESTNQHLTSVETRLDHPPPRLVPRSSLAQGSLSLASPSLLPPITAGNIAKADVTVRQIVPSRRSSQPDGQYSQMTMNLLSSESHLVRSNSIIVDSFAPDSSSPSSQNVIGIRNDENKAKLTPVASTSKRNSLSLLGRSPSRAIDQSKQALKKSQAQIDSDYDNENENDAAFHLPQGQSRWLEPHVPLKSLSSSTIMTSTSPKSGNTEHTSPRLFGKGKGKVAEEDSSTPQIQLKVIPVTDLIIMFGSTQTSSNYSLSGKVVLRIKGGENNRSNHHRLSKMSRSTSASSHRHEDYESDGEIWHSAPMSVSDSGSSFKTANSAVEEEDTAQIHIRNLQVIFSGFALYGDRTGRLATTRLAHGQYELLPVEGSTISYLKSKNSQDYEIEFNLAVPGWLPSSLTSRFGGTFYCLESKAEYCVKRSSRASSNGPLIPPRNGFYYGSTPSLTTFTNGYDSDNLSNGRSIERESSMSQLWKESRRVNTAQDDALISSISFTSQARSSWLSKTARQIQSKVARPSVSPGASQASSTLTTPTQNTRLDLRPLHNRKEKSFYLVECGNGYLRVQSKAKTIVIGRCREVVPVPVARMAIVGPEGLPEGAYQDPPPTPRSSSADRYTRSRSATITPASHRRAPSPPPIMSSAFNAMTDPAKLAASIPLIQPLPSRTPRTPRRESSAMDSIDGPIPSVNQEYRSMISSPSSHLNRIGRHMSRGNYNSTVPMRHFMHQPMLHPPATAQVEGAEGGLPFSLTLTLPSYVTVDGPDSDILNFTVQIEVGRSASWTKVRDLGGLRLRDMELQCIQTERHSSVASRTFCNSYPLPTDTKVDPYDIPVMETWRGHDTRRFPFQQEASKLRAAYDRSLVDDHIELLRLGRAPLPTDQNVERVRTSIVGPPVGHKYRKSAREGIVGEEEKEEGAKSKGKQLEEAENSNGHAATRKKRRKSLVPSQSAPSALLAPSTSRGLDTSPASSDREEQHQQSALEESSNSRRGGRGRRAYQSAIRGLSNLATAVLDISLDVDGTNAGQNGPSNGDGITHKKKNDKDDSQTAVYSFAGSDGHGVDLTRGRVRMAINLPLVSSDATKAKSSGSSRLVADFESPYIRVRHKLKVKLGFGFGDKPLGDEGDGNWGQALVMCVPVRFTDAAPREVREQFAPLPVTQITSSSNSDYLQTPTLPTARGIVGEHDAPLLPSYNQLFREDGSRLADEGEDLPQYPGPSTKTAIRVAMAMPPTGSVTAPSPQLASSVSDHHGSSSDHHYHHHHHHHQLQQNGLGSPIVADPLFDNRITPSRVVDESVSRDQSVDLVTRQQQVEFEEMEAEEEEQVARMTSDRMNETVDLDDEDDLYEDFGEEEDALGIFSLSDQARSGAEDSNAEE